MESLKGLDPKLFYTKADKMVHQWWQTPPKCTDSVSEGAKNVIKANPSLSIMSKQGSLYKIDNLDHSKEENQVSKCTSYIPPCPAKLSRYPKPHEREDTILEAIIIMYTALSTSREGLDISSVIKKIKKWRKSQQQLNIWLFLTSRKKMKSNCFWWT